MDKQAREAREMAKQMPFGDRVRHFWDYHKWHVFAAVIALVFIVTTMVQVMNRVEYDIEIAYYGGMYFTEEQSQKLKEYLSQYIEDVDGNGEINVNITVATAEAPGMNGAQLTEYQAAIGQKFMAEMAARTYDAYIFDESDEYIPFSTTPLFFASNSAKVKLKSLPTSEKAEYLTIPIFCKHPFIFEFKLFAYS